MAILHKSLTYQLINEEVNCMFAEIKNIEDEINQFKTNMNGVDGLMNSVKSICSKMDQQKEQTELFIHKMNDTDAKLQSTIEQSKEELAVVRLSHNNFLQGSFKQLSEKYEDLKGTNQEYTKIIRNYIDEARSENQKVISIIRQEITTQTETNKNTYNLLNQRLLEQQTYLGSQEARQSALYDMVNKRLDEQQNSISLLNRKISFLNVISILGIIILSVLIIVFKSNQ